MNARLKPIDPERDTLHMQLAIAQQKLDQARARIIQEPLEYEFQLNRVKELKYALYGNTLSHTTISRDDADHYGPRDEQRREDEYA